MAVERPLAVVCFHFGAVELPTRFWLQITSTSLDFYGVRLETRRGNRPSGCNVKRVARNVYLVFGNLRGEGWSVDSKMRSSVRIWTELSTRGLPLPAQTLNLG
jgi:hypothetical protein